MSLSRLLARTAWALATVFFVLILNFVLFRVLPGDPVRAGVRDPRLTPEVQEALRSRFGLDKPIINGLRSVNPLRLGDLGANPLDTQLVIYLGNILRGELGVSYHTRRPVREMLAEALGNTVVLLGAGQMLAILLGVSLGILAAWKARTTIDHVALVGSLVAWSLPTFWLGIVLLFWGSHHLGLPVAGMTTPGASLYGAFERAVDLGRHLILPTLTYSIVFLGEYVLIVRSTLLEVLSEDYILTAKAKGLSTFQILKDHALRNALLPVTTLVALNLGFTVTGAVQIETVFSWPGLGGAIFEAVGRRDYPLLQGVFLLVAVSVILANLLADLLYAWLDPRVGEAGP
jgi:peptide/nickel transport system permease protein